jgi:hypothetical protein
MSIYCTVQDVLICILSNVSRFSTKNRVAIALCASRAEEVPYHCRKYDGIR